MGYETKQREFVSRAEAEKFTYGMFERLLGALLAGDWKDQEKKREFQVLVIPSMAEKVAPVAALMIHKAFNAVCASAVSQTLAKIEPIVQTVLVPTLDDRPRRTSIMHDDRGRIVETVTSIEEVRP